MVKGSQNQSEAVAKK